MPTKDTFRSKTFEAYTFRSRTWRSDTGVPPIIIEHQVFAVKVHSLYAPGHIEADIHNPISISSVYGAGAQEFDIT